MKDDYFLTITPKFKYDENNEYVWKGIQYSDDIKLPNIFYQETWIFQSPIKYSFNFQNNINFNNNLYNINITELLQKSQYKCYNITNIHALLINYSNYKKFINNKNNNLFYGLSITNIDNLIENKNSNKFILFNNWIKEFSK